MESSRSSDLIELIALSNFCLPELAQKEVVLFISHVGKSSMIEAVHTATPILAIPMFGDQISNAGHVKGLGVGLVLDIFTLTEAALLGSIQEIIQNKK